MSLQTSTTLLRTEAEFVGSGMKLQAQALNLLLAEMRALSDVMPGATLPMAHRPETDAEVEADFDNMPV